MYVCVCVCMYACVCVRMYVCIRKYVLHLRHENEFMHDPWSKQSLAQGRVVNLTIQLRHKNELTVTKEPWSKQRQGSEFDHTFET